jgi:uncharacterized protein YkwD
MTWKSMFSGIALCAVLGLFLLTPETVPAQKVRIRRSATGRIVSPSTNEQQNARANPGGDEYQIHYLINNERRRKGLGDLYWDNALASMARAFSRQMARESFFSHFDRNGKSVVDRARQSNITGWRKIAENLFFCEGDGQIDALAVRGWMRSAGHRRNILDREFNETGIGIAQTRDGRTYITQVFIRN